MESTPMYPMWTTGCPSTAVMVSTMPAGEADSAERSIITVVLTDASICQRAKPVHCMI